MEEQEFLINQTKQIAVKAISQEEAFKKVLNGEGKVAAMSMSANPRPQQIQPILSGIQSRTQIQKTPTTTVMQPA
jgi:hypothetical protein